MRVTNQGGSLAGFIIIGALLTLVLVGGLYGLNRYNAQRANDEIAASDEAEKKQAQESEDKKQADESREAEANRERTATATESAPRQATPSAPTSSTNGTQATPRATQLPQTGPADTMIMILALSLVTFAGTHFVRSRLQS